MSRKVDELLAGVEGTFFTGAAEYLDAHPGRKDVHPRIYVKLQPEGTDSPYLALVDSGSHYLILSREIAESVKDRLTDDLGEIFIRSAYGLLRGKLFLLQVRFNAEVGEPLDVEVVVFISPDWQGPSFLGYAGGLDRFRFAADPLTNRFFFGPLAEP